MAVIISNIRAKTKETAVSEALRKAGISKGEVNHAEIYKVSTDARHKNLSLVFSVILDFKDKKKEERLKDKEHISLISEGEDKICYGSENLEHRPIIVGFGPAGMFAALKLAENGYKPIVLERGANIEKRTAVCESFFNGGAFSKGTNVQFGEGGAGTFSDGKLTTRINDPLCREVLKRFYEFGADERILYAAKPHLGTDRLRIIVKNLRERVISLGGEIHFENTLTDIVLKNGKIASVLTEKGEIPCNVLILASGHSARDTFKMLKEKGVRMENKPFSVGVRIEHKGEDINRAMFGENYNKEIFGNAEYQLSYRKNDRAVYTFCMCPGGVVVPAASEEDHLCVNGMSYLKRDKENANSAIVVSVDPKSVGEELGCMIDFQRNIEAAAFKKGGGDYIAPVQSVGSFLGKETPIRVTPSYQRGVKEADLRSIFPSEITDMLGLGLLEFNKKIKGFSDFGAVLTAAETRTSSPLRILRGENRESENILGLYPCGEGAGYAGGIMSAAVDGIKTARAIMERYSFNK